MQHKLRQLVMSALMRNDRLSHTNVSITIHGYDVTVHGQVTSSQQSQEALQTIRAVSPLLKIDNRLEVAENFAQNLTKV